MAEGGAENAEVAPALHEERQKEDEAEEDGGVHGVCSPVHQTRQLAPVQREGAPAQQRREPHGEPQNPGACKRNRQGGWEAVVAAAVVAVVAADVVAVVAAAVVAFPSRTP